MDALAGSRPAPAPGTRRGGRSGSARLALLSSLALVACLQDDGTRFNPLHDLVNVSENEERELGLQFDRELRKHVRVIEDPVVAGFINTLGQDLVRGIEPQPFVYRFRVIDDPSLNAFAVPGGYVYFHSGTLLAAASIDELAGIMGHEIAHVKARHYARMRKQQQIPDLLVSLAGMAAAVAASEPGIMVAAQAANVATQLRFSRELEAEADQLGGVFVARAGYRPDAIARFFERLVGEREKHPLVLPPYLYSHPDVEDRVQTVALQARDLRATGAPDPRLPAELADAQGRLAYLLETGRESVPPRQPPDPARADPLLRGADDRVQEGRIDEALLLLARAESEAPGDPRPPYRVGELLAARGRHREAIDAWRRTLRKDPTRAMVFYQLGVSHRAIDERHSAVYAFEQASLRAGATSALRERAEWQIETLIFPVLAESGFEATGADRVTWVGRLSRRYPGYSEHMRVVWRSPNGDAVAETRLERRDGTTVTASLDVAALEGARPGRWTAEVRYREDVIERSVFQLPPRADQPSRRPSSR